MSKPAAKFRAGTRLGKYKLQRRLAVGGFAAVFRARDEVEGVDVALKIPVATTDKGMRQDLLREARVASQLVHPNILALKNADVIDGRLVLAYPLGAGSLADRLDRRIATSAALSWGMQLLSALAYAHERKVIHCDVKPDNVILFEDGTIRLGDFGLARVAAKTIDGSASGTVGYMAPEQALGRPSARSDVFSSGLLLYRMFTGHLPTWPFDWPPPRHERLDKISPELTEVLRRALQLDTRKRYADCGQMLAAYRRATRSARRRQNGTTGQPGPRKDWRSIRLRQLRRAAEGTLTLDHECEDCHHPVDERMQACPWCGTHPLRASGTSRRPATCPRCERGVKLDWVYCAWCYGGKIGPLSDRTFSDREYERKCTSCKGPLLPYSRYCPWCRTRVRRRWSLGARAKPCHSCGEPVLEDFWAACPWCAAKVGS